MEYDEMIIQPFLPYKESLQEDLGSFVQHSLEDTDSEAPGVDDLNALRMCEAALVSSETRRRVNLI